MSTLKEINRAVDILKKNASQFALMHVNSAYPAPVNELNIKCIQNFQKRYRCPIGYSGHEHGLEGTVFAAAMGAKIFERHITLDHTMWGTDQASSIEITGMDLLRKRIKDVAPILGNGIKKITESEKEPRKRLRGA